MNFLNANEQPLRVLITAGASGIGLEIAKGFMAEGCQVHICDINGAAVDAFVNEHTLGSGSVADISKVDDVEAMFNDLSGTLGGLDVLVNCAGIAGPTAPVEECDIEGWNQAVDIDLNGQFYVTRKAVPMLKQAKGGSIVNIASNAALHGFPLRSAYTACKWAMIGLTKTWAMEMGVDGIRVNAICPGSVNGPRIEGVIERDAASRGVSPDEIRTIYQRQSSMRLFVDAEDIANTAKFLASRAGKTISGQAIAVDGHTEGLTNWLES